jgi:hypothetical protein
VTRVQRLLQSTFEQPGDLWALVYTVFGRILGQNYEFELSCEFEPRTDPEACEKRIQFAKYGQFF